MEEITYKRNKFFVYLFIILLAVSPAIFLGDGNRNLLLIGVMSVTPVLLFFYSFIIPKIDIPLILLCLMMILFPLIFHYDTIRWSTILYSCMFCLFFIVYNKILYKSNFKIEDFSILLKNILFAYCIVLVIQQFCVLFGLPIFNVSNYTPDEPWKLNSLMSEPSHSARIIPILMYMYINCKQVLDKNYTFKHSINKDRSVWISFLWAILTMGSSTAFIFLVIIILKIVDFKHFFIPSIILIAISIYIFLNSDNKSITRSRKVFFSTLSLNEEQIIDADHSASFRIVPTIQGAKTIDINSIDGLFGHGVDADSKLIKPLPSVKQGSAGAFYLWFNFGFFVAFLYWIFTFNICFIKNDLISVFIWFLIIFLYGGMNSQIVWLVLFIFTTFKFLTIHK